MYRGATVAVVVPAYEEGNHVGGVIETLPAFVDRAYVVDDCSSDDTWQALDRYADLRHTVGRGDPPEQVLFEEPAEKTLTQAPSRRMPVEDPTVATTRGEGGAGSTDDPHVVARTGASGGRSRPATASRWPMGWTRRP